MAAPKKASIGSNAQPAQPSGNGSGYSGGGSGGGNNYTVTHNYEKEPQNVDELNAQLANAASALGKQNKSIADSGKKALDNIQQQRKTNAQQLLMKNAQLARNSDWQPNQQKEQSVLNNMRRTMGNAAYGSGMMDLQEGMNRFDDMADVELIKTWKENQDEAYNNWYQANADLISDYNEQAIRTQSAFDEAYNNYLQNLANVSARLGKQAYDTKNAGKKITQELGFDKNKKNGIEEDEKEGVISTTVAKNDAVSKYKLTDLLKALVNKASTDNPNIPNTGNVDYIRPNNAVAKARNESLGNVGSVNTSAGAFIPTKTNTSVGKINWRGKKTNQNLKLPGYNYQSSNFAGYNVKR